MKACIKSDHKYYTLNVFAVISYGAIGVCVPNNYTLDYLNYELYSVVIPVIEKQINTTIPPSTVFLLDPSISELK